MDPEVGDRNLRLLLRSICLRRTRVLLDLPNAEDHIVTLSLSTEERSVYSQIVEDTKRKIDDGISSRSIAKARSGIFQAILRLRLLCNNGTQQLSHPDPAIQGGSDEEEYVEGSKLACQFCSCEIIVPDGQDDTSPGTSRQISPQLLCLACLSPNDIDKTRERKKPRKQRHTRNRVQQTKSNSNHSLHSLRPHSEDPASSISLSPNVLPNGHSTKLSALVSNIQRNMVGNKRYVDLTKTLD